MKKSLVTLFILLNFLMMIRAQVDDTTPMARVLFKPATLVQDYFSSYRGWEMFAPNPLRMNMYVDALVEFRTGETTTYKFPVPEGHFQRYFMAGERFRKFSDSGIRKDENKQLWPDTARWILKQIGKKDASRIPSKIHLRRNWQLIPDMEKDFLPHMGENKNEWSQFKFYTYEVL